MVAPRYQDVAAASLPVAQTEAKDVQVKVIAGESLGRHAAVETRTPILFLHATLQPGASMEQPVPGDYRAFAYVINGEGRMGPENNRVPEGHVAVFAKSGDVVRLSNSASVPLNVLLIGGAPLGEPVARYGPFVMNTKAELHQAVEDYQNGRMGVIVAR
jgi:redox-sensitive bicupin YhaK (pirin superfamily)